MSTLELWQSVEKTNPAHTKGFKRGGGFEGTAVSPMYLIHKATELWGPMGGAWGVDVVDEKILDGAPLLNSREEVVGCEKVHEVRITLRHPGGVVPAVGQTTFVGKNKYGPFTDEEAPKKSLTDALSKALSWLGFAADIHMGRYDDNKYVNDLRREFAEKPPAPMAVVIPATVGAGRGLSDERRAELDDMTLTIIEAGKQGRELHATELYYSIEDNDEKVYVWSQMKTESALRRFIKENSPHKAQKSA